MTRIIAGAAAATQLDVPARGTRPTSDKVRGALFSSLGSWFDFADARVLDLYAGSGALGLEAVSRGAESLVLVEQAAKAARIARANVSKVLLRCQQPVPQVSVATASVRHWLANAIGMFDLVFCDPPYDLPTEVLEGDLALLRRRLSADAPVVVERSTRTAAITLPQGYSLWRTRDYGETQISYLEVAPIEPAA